MKFAFLPWLLLLMTSGLVHSESPGEATWRAGKGSMTLELRGDYLTDFGIEILDRDTPVTGRQSLRFRVRAVEPFGLNVRWGNIESLEPRSGPLIAEADLAFHRNGRTVQADGLRLEPGSRAGHPVIAVLDEQGRSLFTLSHIHLALRPDSGVLAAMNAEVEASAELARHLDFVELSGMPIGTARLTLDLEGGARSEPAGLPEQCEGRPLWPQENEGADIQLIGMDNVAYQGTHEDGRIKIAPSAILKNVSNVDIPWIRQFESLASYPHDPADQHAYLVWNLYRIAEGRIEMLAGSGAKHAFYSVNQNCDFACGSNNVVWPGCEDVYAASSNDLSAHQGPRHEIQTSIGLWDSCSSFFDTDCDGVQEGYAGEWQHRLLVAPAELETPGAEYFIDAWYVVQYDKDIWNTMGSRPIDPARFGHGWIMNAGPYRQGPAISRWIPANTSAPNTDHDIITVPSDTPEASYPDDIPQGHLRLLVKVAQIEPGRYRYNYALQNFDFDRGLEGFRVNVPIGSDVFETAFRDTDANSENDWTVKFGEDHVLFTASPGNELGWFELFNFEVETSALPVSSEVTLKLGEDASQSEIGVKTLGPASGTGLLFEDRFSGFEMP